MLLKVVLDVLMIVFMFFSVWVVCVVMFLGNRYLFVVGLMGFWLDICMKGFLWIFCEKVWVGVGVVLVEIWIFVVMLLV